MSGWDQLGDVDGLEHDLHKPPSRVVPLVVWAASWLLVIVVLAVTW